jgi:hypothetical protein
MSWTQRQRGKKFRDKQTALTAALMLTGPTTVHLCKILLQIECCLAHRYPDCGISQYSSDSTPRTLPSMSSPISLPQ